MGRAGAPVFFINGQELQGAHSEARFSQVLEQAIAAASPVRQNERRTGRRVVRQPVVRRGT